MSQKSDFPLVNETSLDGSTNSNNDWKSVDQLPIVENNGWANFDAFENRNPESVPGTTSNNTDDEWAEFQSNTDHSIEFQQDEKAIKSDDDQMQISPTSLSSNNSLTTDQIETLISTCFPLESSTLFIESGDFLSVGLPTFTTCHDQTKQLTCFRPSLRLWNVLSNISNDPRGIQYQWRKSNTERYFHQSLGVHERFRTKIIPPNSTTSPAILNVDHENKPLPRTIDPHFEWKQSGLENPLTDVHSSFSPSKIEDTVVDASKALDLDYYVPPSRKETTTSSPITHRNNSPMTQQKSTPIKTTHLFPGSTRVLNDVPKPVVNLVANFTFINPKALMSSTQTTHESAS